MVYVRTDGRATTQRILTHAFHKFEGGSVFYQGWSKGFNLHTLANLFWPMYWISIPELFLEYQKLGRRIAEQVGEVFVEVTKGGLDGPPRFCVGVDMSKGWVSNVVCFTDVGGVRPSLFSTTPSN